jgi:hypothetical protein
VVTFDVVVGVLAVVAVVAAPGTVALNVIAVVAAPGTVALNVIAVVAAPGTVALNVVIVAAPGTVALNVVIVADPHVALGVLVYRDVGGLVLVGHGPHLLGCGSG